MMNKKLSLAIFVTFLVTALFSANSLLAVDNTVLYLQGEGTTIKDTSGKNYQVTVNGNTSISTTKKKFGNSSIYFDGSGDNLIIPDSDDWNFGTSIDFTVDFWVLAESTSLLYLLESEISPRLIMRISTTYFCASLPYNVNNFQIYRDFSTAWTHVAVVRKDGVIKLYLDGVLQYTVTASVNIAKFTKYIGSCYDGGYFKGYLDEFRITKGQALWTANFTPPSALPTVNFSASKDLINNGQSVTFNWSTIDASGCTLQYNNTNQVVQLPSGTLTLSPNAPTTYTLIATGPGGTTYKEINVKVLNGYTTTGPFTVATKIGVGVMNPQNALEVNGTIKAKEVQVSLNNWPDYVFSQNYDLRSLAELEAFIQKNGRLPEMPSAQELENQGGSVAEILKKQMQKIEELTLYIIRLQKQIEELKKE